MQIVADKLRDKTGTSSTFNKQLIVQKFALLP